MSSCRSHRRPHTSRRTARLRWKHFRRTPLPTHPWLGVLAPASQSNHRVWAPGPKAPKPTKNQGFEKEPPRVPHKTLFSAPTRGCRTGRCANTPSQWCHGAFSPPPPLRKKLRGTIPCIRLEAPPSRACFVPPITAGWWHGGCALRRDEAGPRVSYGAGTAGGRAACGVGYVNILPLITY